MTDIDEVALVQLLPSGWEIGDLLVLTGTAWQSKTNSNKQRTFQGLRHETYNQLSKYGLMFPPQ